jgi:hypothetical protein
MLLGDTIDLGKDRCVRSGSGDKAVEIRPGNDLLSRVLRHSTISAEKFNGRVRDGIGFWLLAQATGPAKNIGKQK